MTITELKRLQAAYLNGKNTVMSPYLTAATEVLPVLMELPRYTRHLPECDAGKTVKPVDGGTGWIYVRDEPCTCGLSDLLRVLHE